MTTDNVFEITRDARTVLGAVGWSIDRVNRHIEDFLAQRDPWEVLPAAAEFLIRFPEPLDPLHIWAIQRSVEVGGWEVTVRTEREWLAWRAAATRTLARYLSNEPDEQLALLEGAKATEEELRQKYPGESPRLGPSNLVN